MKVLIATEKPFASAAVKGIKEIVEAGNGTVTLLEKYTKRSELIDALKAAEALIVRSDKIDKDILDTANNLKIIVRAGAGYDNIDTKYAKQKGIIVENTPGQNSNAVAELVFGLLVLAARNSYNGKVGIELKGKKLGIFAFGNVGRNVARIAKGFDMDIMAYDAYCPKETIESEGVMAATSADELFEKCDIVSLHIPATSETRQSIGTNYVSKMKKNAILINTARKEIIDEAELLETMRQRDDIRYITDIKPDAEEEFKKLEGRYIGTQKKLGAQTTEANANAGLAAAKQVMAFFKDGCTQYQVNL